MNQAQWDKLSPLFPYVLSCIPIGQNKTTDLMIQIARWTQERFERAAARTRCTPDTLRLARQHLVDGLRQSEIGVKNKSTKQNVNRAVNRLKEADLEEVPRGWTQITIAVPEALAKPFLDIADVLVEKYRSLNQQQEPDDMDTIDTQ